MNDILMLLKHEYLQSGASKCLSLSWKSSSLVVIQFTYANFSLSRYSCLYLRYHIYEFLSFTRNPNEWSKALLRHQISIQSHINLAKMWKSRNIFLTLWIGLLPLEAMEIEVVELVELVNDFLPLSNTELVFISDFSSQKKVIKWIQFNKSSKSSVKNYVLPKTKLL